MHKVTDVEQATAALTVGVTASMQDKGAAKLTALHREIVETLPRDAAQEIRVLHARLDPGDRTPHHSHRHPVTVYMLEGAFTLHLADRPEPVTVRAGEVFVEPAHVNMTGHNLDPLVPATMVLFYACTPDTPFADPVR
jgi:quercetin dioxygenase-like cupin family protein